MSEQIDISDSWARWELEPIDSSGRHTVDELMILRGRLTAAFLTKKVLQRKPGSRLRTRLLTTAMRGGFGLTNRREYDLLFRSSYTEDCELSYEAFFPDMGEGTQRGPREIERYLLSFDDAYSSLAFQPCEVVDPGGESIATAIVVTAVGFTTGIEISQLTGVIYSFENGRICRQQVYRDWPTTIERLKQETGAGTA